MSIGYDDFMELARARRSVRRFRRQPLPEGTVERLLEAARWAPSAGNRQPQRWIPVEDQALIARCEEAVGQATGELRAKARRDRAEEFSRYLEHLERFGGAPLVLAQIVRLGPDLLATASAGGAQAPPSDVVPRGTLDSLSSAAAALQNLLLAASALGLGACWMTGPLVAREALTELLEVPKGWHLAALVPVGYAAEDASPPPRKATSRLLRPPPSPERS